MALLGGEAGHAIRSSTLTGSPGFECPSRLPERGTLQLDDLHDKRPLKLHSEGSLGF